MGIEDVLCSFWDDGIKRNDEALFYNQTVLLVLPKCYSWFLCCLSTSDGTDLCWHWITLIWGIITNKVTSECIWLYLYQSKGGSLEIHTTLFRCIIFLLPYSCAPFHFGLLHRNHNHTIEICDSNKGVSKMWPGEH